VPGVSIQSSLNLKLRVVIRVNDLLANTLEIVLYESGLDIFLKPGSLNLVPCNWMRCPPVFNNPGEPDLLIAINIRKCKVQVRFEGTPLGDNN
jgi:hypothetical protein